MSSTIFSPDQMTSGSGAVNRIRGKVFSGGPYTLLTFIVFVCPVIILGVCLEDSTLEKSSKDALTTSIVFYSVFLGLFLTDNLTLRSKKFFNMFLIFISIAICFGLAFASKDERYKNSFYVAIGFIVLVSFVVLYAGSSISDTEFLINAPNLGNYIKKLNNLSIAVSDNDDISESLKKSIASRQETLFELYGKMNENPADYVPASGTKYSEIEDEYKNIDREIFGQYDEIAKENTSVKKLVGAVTGATGGVSQGNYDVFREKYAPELRMVEDLLKKKAAINAKRTKNAKKAAAGAAAGAAVHCAKNAANSAYEVA